jgi:16S rRNA (cytosine1402-N4)-methyltransferase
VTSPSDLAQTATHSPVLRDEVVQWLAHRPLRVVIDATVGAGGHARALAQHLAPQGRLVGLDRDPEMLALAQHALAGMPVTLIKAPYSAIGSTLDDLGLPRADAILLDLGVSSDQLAWSHRGFSFSGDGPLDMRFDPDEPAKAADLVNDLPASELANIIFRYGEERFSRRIARRIVEEREARGPILSTARLAAIVRRAVPGKRGPIDPATRTFQALRIAVNHELDHLDSALAHAADWLAPLGRIAVISFHSLEDRRVKHAFRDDPRLTNLTRKPITASQEERIRNPRARSAKLRVAERCTNTN